MMTSTLNLAIATCATFIVVAWLLSLLTREYSWVDRLWSIAPPVYVWIAWSATAFSDLRVGIMTVLTTLWGARLTFNYARKGGYAKGGEDHRWGELQKRMTSKQFQWFNFAFIATYQNLLLLLISLPAFVSNPEEPIGVLEVLAALAFLFFLVGETVADQQQWRFQQEKKARLAQGNTGPEFLTTGLFEYSRHPNFFCEQAMWWCIYTMSISSAGWINGTIAGAILLTLLFQGSASFTERLSLAKYPSYAEYQKTTPCMFPRPPRASRSVGAERA